MPSVSSINTTRSSATEVGTEEISSGSGAEGAEPSEEDIQRKPWKFIGYKGYASFIASESDFFILRRFDALNARVALALQDEVSLLEEKLNVLDKRYSKTESEDFHNGTFRGDLENRTELLDTIAEKLRRYNEFVLQQSSLRKFARAPRRDVKSIRNWHYNHDYAAIAADEQKYLDHEDDLICVVPKDKTPLRRLIDGSLRLRTLAIWRKRKDNVPDIDDRYVSYYSDKRMDRFASAAIVAVGTMMLIIPIWILQALERLTMRLVLITIFVFIFLLVLSFAMVAKPFEALGATAAYAAVLMVFIQLGTTS